MGEMEQDAEWACTKGNATRWLAVARAGSLGGKPLGFAEEVGDPGEWMQAAVQEGEVEQAVAAWQSTMHMDARIQA